jgi:hypothetical protein
MEEGRGKREEGSKDDVAQPPPAVELEKCGKMEEGRKEHKELLNHGIL